MIYVKLYTFYSVGRIDFLNGQRVAWTQNRKKKKFWDRQTMNRESWSFTKFNVLNLLYKIFHFMLVATLFLIFILSALCLSVWVCCFFFPSFAFISCYCWCLFMRFTSFFLLFIAFPTYHMAYGLLLLPNLLCAPRSPKKYCMDGKYIRQWKNQVKPLRAQQQRPKLE